MEAFSPSEVWKPFGPFSQAVIQGEGRIVHLKGQVALDRDGKVVGTGDMKAQTRKALENIRAVLASVGGQMTDVVSLTHYVTDIEQFMQTSDIRREFFSSPFPATTTVEVKRLYRTELLVEISATAEIPVDRFKAPNLRSGS